MSKVHDVLLNHKRIDQKQYDVLIAKEAERAAAIEDYKKNKDKKTKAELTATIEKLIK